MEICRKDVSRRSKTDRRSSKQAALQLLASITGTDCSQQLIKVPAQGRVSLGSIPQRHVYSELALVLGSAMQAHMERNPVLRSALHLNNEQVCMLVIQSPVESTCAYLKGCFSFSLDSSARCRPRPHLAQIGATTSLLWRGGTRAGQRHAGLHGAQSSAAQRASPAH
jgi:hypothetical protein